VLGIGNNSTGIYSGNYVAGVGNQSAGIATGNYVAGLGNTSMGIASGNFVFGVGNQASGIAAGNFVYGAGNQASGNFAGNNVAGFDNIAIGTGAGNFVYASRTTSIGTGARAGADDATAIGTGASADYKRSTAIGFGSETTHRDQIAYGNIDGSTTHTMNGITSDKSKARQTDGPLEVVTTDQTGNLASDGGYIFNKLNSLDGRDKELAEGIAIATALQNPDLVGAETFGVAVNFGNWDGFSAFGLSAEGVVGYNFFQPGDRVAVSGGVGVGTREGTVAGRVGVQWTR
jgi:hypothetical protein